MISADLAHLARIRRRSPVLRSWRSAAAGTAMAAGATVIAGCLLPWAEVFAGLIGIPGVRGSNGKLLVAAGALLVAAGLWHLIRGDAASRWVAGLAGAAIAGFAGLLLMRLSATLRALGGDSMMAARGGPGLWVVAAGGLAAFATMFFPQSGQRALVARKPGGGLAAWAADRESAGPRRWIQLALGAFWLLDAGLQAQPYMFSRGFVTQNFGGAAMGNPAALSNPVMGVSQILLAHPAAFNAGFAVIQLALGLGLLWRRTARAALAGTIVWALSVWWLGEGLGGILTPAASAVTGAPGAALLYAIIAGLAWPSRPGSPPADTIAAGSPAGRLGARLAWLAVWAGTALVTVLALIRAPGSLHTSLARAADGEPGPLAALDRASAHLASAAGPALPIIVAVVFAAIAAAALVPATRRAGLILAVVTALVLWVAGQDLGGIFTGRGTDPNAGPLLILLAAAYWPVSAIRNYRPHEPQSSFATADSPSCRPDASCAVTAK